MTVNRTALVSAAAGALVAALVTLGLGANAQTAGAPAAAGERVVGYAVYARSQYLLLQRSDGRMRTCTIRRDSLITGDATWKCEAHAPLPQ